ncbi:MAG: molybdenum cofactor biosynthesis protein MoaE [Halobacteriales archaeon]|nr:molybdenum cofactor biosynthesis protein MoaE [Halobacteriales archaeon]
MQAAAVSDVRIAPRLDASEALAWMGRGEGGAISLVVTRARGCAVRCAPAPDARERLERAAAQAAAVGATRVLVWQAEGVVTEGGAIAVVGVLAEHRKEAVAGTQILLGGLKGVARRQDLPAAPAGLPPAA